MKPLEPENVSKNIIIDETAFSSAAECFKLHC